MICRFFTSNYVSLWGKGKGIPSPKRLIGVFSFNPQTYCFNICFNHTQKTYYRTYIADIVS